MTTSIPSRLLLPLLLSLLILCAACAGAPTNAIQSPLSDAEAQATHDSLRAFHAKIITAFNASDIDTLMSCVDERVIFVAVNNDLVQGRDAARAYFEKMLKGSTPILKSISTVMEPDGLSTLHSPSLAIAHGTATTTYSLTTGQSFTTKTRWTATVIRVQDQWKVISFQDAAGLFDDASRRQPE
jgi:ketosteroid isomerase-like protein